MVTTLLYIWVEFDVMPIADRLSFYLHSETRPDFHDEVPLQEADWVDAFEFLPEPTSIKRINKSSLFIFFDSELNPDSFELCKAIGLFKPKLLLTLESVEGDDSYDRWSDGNNTLVYAPEGLENQEDNLKYNNNLSQNEILELDLLSDEPERALAYVADVILSK